MITIPDALRRPAEIERDELRRQLQGIEEREAACCPEDVPFDEYIKALGEQLARARTEIERKDRLFRQTWGALLFCRRIGYPCRGSFDEFSDVNDFAVQIQKAYSLELLNTLINAAESEATDGK